MKINKAMSNEKLDVWECKCGTYTPVKKGSPKPECEYCRRGKQKVLKKKLLWRGTLGELRKHYLYSLIKEDVLVEVGKVIDSFDFMKEVNYICEGMKCPSDWKLHTKEDINKWIRIQQKKELGI